MESGTHNRSRLLPTLIYQARAVFEDHIYGFVKPLLSVRSYDCALTLTSCSVTFFQGIRAVTAECLEQVCSDCS